MSSIHMPWFLSTTFLIASLSTTINFTLFIQLKVALDIYIYLQKLLCHYSIALVEFFI